jgi:hypothetical protein
MLCLLLRGGRREIVPLRREIVPTLKGSRREILPTLEPYYYSLDGE